MARLAVPLCWQWGEEGRLSEIDRWLSLARERSDEYALPVQAGVLAVARRLAQDRGNLDQAVGLADQALALYRELGDINGIFWEMLIVRYCPGAIWPALAWASSTRFCSRGSSCPSASPTH